MTLPLPTFDYCDDGISRVELGSVSELVQVAMTRGQANYAGNVEAIERHITSAERSSRRRDWFNGYTARRVLEALNDPPADLIRQVEQVKESIEALVYTPTAPRRRMVRRLDMGDELSAEAWAQREPNGWSETRRTFEPRRTLRIAVNLTVSCARRAEHLLYRGAAAAALADAFTAQGFSVEVVAFDVGCITEREDTSVLKVIVKPADAPLDLGTLAFCLSEIAFYRMVALTASARLGAGELRCGWGSVKSLPVRERGDFHVVLDSDITDEHSAAAVLRRFAAGNRTSH